MFDYYLGTQWSKKHGGTNEGKDVIGNLHSISLMEACARFRQRVAVYIADKQERVRNATLTEEDYFPCVYCVKYMGKTSQRELHMVT